MTRVRVRVAFGGHDSQSDVDKFASLLSEADVYMPEMPGEELTDLYQSVSQGEIDPSSIDTSVLRFGEFTRATLAALYGSQKVIWPVHVPHDHSIHKAISAIHDEATHLREDARIAGYSLTEAAARWIILNEKNALLQLERQAYVASRIADGARGGVVRATPALAGKDPIEMLCTIGAWHYPMLVDTLRREHVEPEVHLIRRPLYARVTEPSLAARATVRHFASIDFGRHRLHSSHRALIDHFLAKVDTLTSPALDRLYRAVLHAKHPFEYMAAVANI